MGALYPGTSVSGYNSNPPPDDGSTVSTNLITWAGIKSKLGDPLNTFDTNVDSNITAAFGKTIDGATVVSTAVNYAATAADQGRLISVTASGHTVTTPDAGTVGAPFIFGVTNQSTGTITLAPNATNSQTLDGSTSGLVVQAGGSCFAKTDGTNWFSIAYKAGNSTVAQNNFGFTDPVNVNLSASVGSNLLTVTLLNKAGNTPSASDPVQIAFRDTTIANGDPVWVSVTAATSISTNATGASLGTQSSSVPFKLWVLAFNNSGTVVLALWHSGAGASSIAINPLNEGTLQSTTGISAAATSSGVFYTPNGTSLSSKSFRILGYVEYSSGLATAGTYASAPTIVQLFGPGIKKPGDIVQSAFATRTSSDTTTSTTFTTTGANLSATLTPSSAANLARVTISTNCSPGAVSDGAAIAVMRGGNVIGVGNGAVNSSLASSAIGSFPLSVEAIEMPATASSATWTCGIRAITGGTATFHSNAGSGSGGSMSVWEIMG